MEEENTRRVYVQNYYYALLMTINVTLTFVVMFAACLCCKKRIPKNDLLGLEGMVKMKNPDEVIIITTVGNSESQVDLNLSTISNADSEKRASTAAHRSLPDIPVADINGDNGSELYETVADKRLMDAQNNQHKSPIPSLKKQTSVSQHSSISQADDVSSPYSRVKNSPHDYAKVRSTEHPYAQLNAPSTSGAAAAAAAAISAGNSSQLTLTNESNRNSSHHSDSSQNLNDSAPQAEIPAASAIAGMISASQDLPYMTPPIANQQHFSGDSQDSSKGYTSISVREPLANILAQQPPKSVQRNQNSRDVNDSHYATVSDDSDETYAAIEDPNGRNNPNAAADIYTSGSETYAQIQPMQVNSIFVAVEINNSSAANNLASSAVSGSVAERGAGSASLPTHSSNVQLLEHNSSNVIHTSSTHHSTTIHNRPSADHNTPVPPPVDSLRAQIHSRQASSSSNNSSSMGNLGSPKPEKRQANSPLPPTPKSNQTNSSSSNLASGRNSVISVIELSGLDASGGSGSTTTIAAEGGSPQKRNKSLSPSKDIEGMYAKVMKKNKFSRNSPSSQSNSPILTRKYNDHSSSLGVSPLDSAAAELIDMHKIAITSSSNTTDKSRTRSNSYSSKDHGYETIPADGIRCVATGGLENRKSDCYANILQKERQQEGAHNQNASASLNYPNAKPPIDSSESSPPQKLIYHSEKHYETIAAPRSAGNGGYETLLNPKNQTDPVSAKKANEYDPNYEVLQEGPKYAPATPTTNSNHAVLSDDGYAKVVDKKRLTIDEEEDSADGYSKVKGEECDDGAIGGYSTIGEVKADSTDANHNYASISETKARAFGEVAGNNGLLETDSDHYARIAEERLPTAPNLPLSSVAAPAKTGDDTLTPVRLPELPINSPSSVNSSSLMNHSGSTNLTTTSSTTMSSRQTPSSSQYESLTGSDTDPNYESVCYLNTSQENPYERLQPDDCSTDTQLSSPLSPDEHTATSAEPVPPVKSSSSNGPLKANAAAAATDFNSDVVVDDYFQV